MPGSPALPGPGMRFMPHNGLRAKRSGDGDAATAPGLEKEMPEGDTSALVLMCFPKPLTEMESAGRDIRTRQPQSSNSSFRAGTSPGLSPPGLRIIRMARCAPIRIPVQTKGRLRRRRRQPKLLCFLGILCTMVPGNGSLGTGWAHESGCQTLHSQAPRSFFHRLLDQHTPTVHLGCLPDPWEKAYALPLHPNPPRFRHGRFFPLSWKLTPLRMNATDPNNKDPCHLYPRQLSHMHAIWVQHGRPRSPPAWVWAVGSCSE